MLITEDYTVVENQTINEELILDGANHCTIQNNTIHGQLTIHNYSVSNTISNNTIHGRLFIYNFSEYNTISDNIVDELIYIIESAYNTLTGNNMGGYFMDTFGGGGSPTHRFNQTIDTTNLVKGKPLHFYFDVHDTVIEELTDVGQLFIVASSNVTIRNLNMDTAGIFLKASNDCIITNCVVGFPIDGSVFKVGWTGINFDNCGSPSVNGSIITLSGSYCWGIYGDTVPYGEFSNNTVSVSGTSSRGIHIYASHSVMVSNSTITATNNAYGLTIAYPYGDGIFYITSNTINGPTIIGGATGSADGDVYYLDTTFNSLSVNDTWTAYCLWYLDATVTDSAGDPVEGATVTASDKDDVEVLSTITDSNGNIPQQSLLGYTKTATETTHSTPYTITATKLGQSDSKSIDLTESTTVSLDLGELSPDTSPPSAVTDLAASSPTSDSITLTWTAPGDDGVIGTASQYDIRYSTTEISEANWDLATQCTGEPAPQVAGSTETFAVPGLAPNTTYYFALKTSDEVPNWASVSNSPTETTAEIVGGLVGHWKFDEGEGTTAHDSSGEGNDGTVYGASWTTGILGAALAFDATNDYLDCGQKDSLCIPGDMTVSMWVRLNDLSAIQGVLSAGGRALGKNDQYAIWIYTNQLRYLSGDGINGNIISILPPPPTGEWINIAFVREGANIQWYLDGEPLNSGLITVTPRATLADTVLIGALDTGAPYYPFDGLIDEVKIYNRALSSPEVLALYQEGLCPKPTAHFTHDTQPCP